MYIQSATLNGEEFNSPWIYHETIKDGSTLVLKMGDSPNKDWGTGE